MKKISTSSFIVFCLSSSLCVAEKSPDKCGRGNFNLTVIGRRMEDEKWNTSYHLDSSSCNATDNLEFIVQQNITEFGGKLYVHLRGFFTENVNRSSVYIPTHVVVTDVSQGPLSKAHSERDLVGRCKGENVTEELELQVVSRKEWRARNSTRDIDKWDEPVDKIFVNYTGTFCLNKRICKLLMLIEQDDHIPSHGDIAYNFYSDEDGVIYEGLGWERRIGGDCSLIYFLDGGNLPSNQQLQSFSLLIAQGIKLGKISPNFTVVGESRVLFESRVRFTGNQEQELKIVSRHEWNARQPTKEIPVRVNPYPYVKIMTLGLSCFNISMCKLAMLKEQNERILYNDDILYNFYSGGDGLVYEGLGWDRTRSGIFHLAYFGDSMEPPSLQQLLSSSLLVAEGVKLGKMIPNFGVFGYGYARDFSKKWFRVMKYA